MHDSKWNKPVFKRHILMFPIIGHSKREYYNDGLKNNYFSGFQSGVGLDRWSMGEYLGDETILNDALLTNSRLGTFAKIHRTL